MSEEVMPDGLPPTVVLTAPQKPWWKSRQIWLNVIVLMLGAAETQLQVLQPLLPVNVYALIAFGLPPLNIALRFLNTQDVCWTNGGAGSCQLQDHDGGSR